MNDLIQPSPRGDVLRCRRCNTAVGEVEDFCPRCGNLFHKSVNCTVHPDRAARGVCVVCATALCGRCGKQKRGVWLCAEHAHYEIYQSMVRVFGTRDAVQAQYAASCLEQAGAHAFVYSRMPAMSAEGEAGIVGEHKVLVPPGEVLAAEQLLGELGILGSTEAGSQGVS